MKKILLVAGLALFGLPVFAQNNASQSLQDQSRDRGEAVKVHKKQFDPEMVANAKTARLDKVVSLDDGQKQKVKAIYLQEAQVHKNRVTLRRETQEQVNAVLTDAQKAKLDDYKNEKAKAIKYQKVKRSTLKHAPATTTLQVQE